MTDVASFWDGIYATTGYSRDVDHAVFDSARQFFGDLSGKTIIEIGCGPGSYALRFASLGATVVGIDISKKAIDDLNEFCAQNGITTVRGICANVLDLSGIEPVDFVFGSMILHHIEPFKEFAGQLESILKPGGRGFFYENNAASRVLIWFRQNVVGRLWVPKHGDPDEFPLTPQEVDELRHRFQVRIEYPELMLFELIGVYLFRNRLRGPLRSVDEFFYRRKWLLRYSYRQYVMITAR